MSVKFSRGDTSIWLQNPDLSDVNALAMEQVVEKNTAGRYYRFSLATPVGREIELSFANLRRSERDALDSFFEDTAQGALLNWTYTDERGVDHNAHFVETELRWTTVADAVASSGTFTSGGTAYPTTTRTGGVYATKLRLFIW